MNRHVGASFTLSFSIVGFFAIVLYQPEDPPHPTSESPTVTQDGMAESTSPDSLPALAHDTSSAGPITESAHESNPEQAAGPTENSLAFPGSEVSTATEGTADLPARPIFPASTQPQLAARRRVPVPRRPRSAFTEVVEGESLADVAARVYGTPDAARTLWQANRDMIKGQEPRLQVGMLLRTP